MVRTGELPFRLLALEYGADLVYSPEVIDKALIGCSRFFDAHTGVASYKKSAGDQRTVFRTHVQKERGKLILQLGSADPQIALDAARIVGDDVAGIDLNCGCPKHFSVHAGMGAALLKNPDKLCSILEHLVKGTDKPVSVKIRMLETEAETVQLVQRLAKTGISALAIHCRTRKERPQDPGHWSIFRPVVDALDQLGIPVIANGDVFSRDDGNRVREESGCSSYMMARAAQLNVSVFRTEGPLNPEQVARRYVTLVHRTHNRFENAKYVLSAMFGADRRAGIHSAKSLEDLADLFGVTLDSHEGTDDVGVGDEKADLSDDLCPYMPDPPYIPSR